jgi:aldehyde:ferredoxin oxidoreductase
MAHALAITITPENCRGCRRLGRNRYEQLLTEYYGLRGWGIATGIPTRATCRELGLDWGG